MTNPTGGEWEQSANIIYSEQGNICSLSDPHSYDYITHCTVGISSPNWNEAMANGKLIVEAVKAYRYLIEKYGENWRDKI
jgi:hypothetical protein